MSIYTDEGFKNRKEYVLDLADNLGVPHNIALMAAEILGKSEDFDGLVIELEDYAQSHPEECGG